MGITLSGAGSGLDIEALVTQLVNAERAPTERRLNEQESKLDAQLSAFGKLKSALSDFEETLYDLKRSTSFQAKSATSGNEDLFTATADGSAAVGSYNIDVLRTAEYHKMAANTTYADTTTSIGAAGTMTLSGNSTTFDVTLDGKSLGEIRDAINATGNDTGVTATILNDGSGNRLVLSSETSGSDGYFSVAYSGADPFSVQTLNTDRDGSGTFTSADLDAEFTVDGFTVTSSSNTVENVIDGVTLNLHASSSELGLTGSTKLDIGKDAETVKDTIQKFVDGYNKIADLVGKYGDYDSETESAGALLGDSALRSIANQLRSDIGDAVNGLTGNFSTLAEIGITTDSEGRLTVDETELDDALATGFADVDDLFTSTDGIATTMHSLVSGFLETDGLIDGRQDSLNARLDSIGDQRERLDYRIDMIEERYRRQFSALDAMLGEMRSEGDYLMQQLASLPGVGG